MESVIRYDGQSSLCAIVRRDGNRAATAEPAAQAPAPATRAAEPAPVPVTEYGEPDWRALGAPQTAGRQALQARTATRSAYTAPREAADIAAPSAAAIRAGEIVAGGAAEGHGAFTGWGGAGAVAHSVILAWLEAAGLPADWAPRITSAISHAGKAVGDLNLAGYVCRRTRVGNVSRERRTWAARWTVFRATGNRADLVTVELPLESDDLTVWCDPARADEAAPVTERILRVYRELRNAEIHGAADVTAWIARVLCARCGATGFGPGFYIPAGGREIAAQLVNTVSEVWGREWIAPIVPLATGDELRRGIARGFAADVRRQVAVLERERATAKAETPPRSEIGPRRAATLLRELQATQDRIAAYRLLCGDAAIAPVVAEIGTLRDTLAGIADDASLRFALLDLDVGTEAPAPVTGPTPAERAADAALEARRRGEPAERDEEPAFLTGDARPTVTTIAAPAPAPVVTRPPTAPPVDPGERTDLDERTSLLEWD